MANHKESLIDQKLGLILEELESAEVRIRMAKGHIRELLARKR